MNNYYTYIYLDPRKPGKFSYLDFNFEFEPFYVGKGKNNRLNDHIHEYGKYNNYLRYKIRKIKRDTFKLPIVLKVKDNIFEKEALELEKLLIKIIGRYDLKLGPLCNLTDGGEGGVNKSLETIQKISNSSKGKIISEKARNALKVNREFPILAIDKDMNVLEEFETMGLAAKKYNITHQTVYYSCNTYKNLRNGVSFRYKVDLVGQKTYLNNKNNDKSRKYFQGGRRYG